MRLKNPHARERLEKHFEHRHEQIQEQLQRHHPPSLYLNDQRHPHKWFKSTHLHLTDSHDRPLEYQSRRARKGRYRTRPHRIHHDGKASSVFIRVPSHEERVTPHFYIDISFWVATIFTFGCTFWVINGILAWLPNIYPVVGRPVIARTNSAIGFIGGFLFVVGSYLGVVEALDRGRETNFSTALGRLLHHHKIVSPSRPASPRTSTDPLRPDQPEAEQASSGGSSVSDGGTRTVRPHEKDDEWPAGTRGFVWWGKPMWRDIGYDAIFVNLIAAIIFWVATITGLNGVIPHMSEGRHRAVAIVLNWTPQVVGSVGFIISSTLMMLEVQTKWYIPEPFDPGWQVGFWNLIGSFGFLLCGCFGYSLNSGMVYQSTLSTFWGSFAFWIGSFFMMWEVIMREPPLPVNQGPEGKERFSSTHPGDEILFS